MKTAVYLMYQPGGIASFSPAGSINTHTAPKLKFAVNIV